MKTLFRLPSILGVLAGALGPVAPKTHAFPPAPHHLIEGVVRDAFGHPLTQPTVRIVIESASGVQVLGRVNPELDGGLNYTLTIPMDAGLTPDVYRPTALQPLVPFKIKVRIGNVTYLPIEMTGNYATLGMPAKRTRLDLTLGEDSDGDGLPDAWERSLDERLGGNLSLSDIRPDDDLDGDGLTNLQEYLAGTYAYAPEGGIALDLERMAAGQAVLSFTVVTGRSYSILASDDLGGWTPVSFTMTGASEAPRAEFRATDVRLLRVQVPLADAETSSQRFFKLRVR